MSKAKFRFNPETLEYEKVSNSILLRIGKIFGFTSLAIISGITTYLILNQDQTTEQLKNQLVDYQIQVKLLEQKSGEMQSSLDELASMDDHVYREIFGADPIEDDIRKAGTGGVNKYISLEYISPAKILLRSNSSPENKVIIIKSNVKSMIIS